MWQTPKSALYLRNKLWNHFLSGGDSISRSIHRLLSAEIPFSFGNTRKSVLPLASVSFVCWSLPVQVGLLLFAELFRGVQWTWICSRIFNALCWLSMQISAHKLWVYPKAKVRDHLGELLLDLEELMRSGSADLTVPDHPLPVLAGVSSPARRELLTEWGILGRAVHNLMQPCLLEMHFSLKTLYHHKSEFNEIPACVVGSVRWKYTERCWGGLVALFGNE